MHLNKFAVFIPFLVLGALCCGTSKSRPFPAQWRLEELNGVQVPDSIVTTLRFDTAQARISGSAACNGYGGNYQRGDSDIQFSSIVSTKRFCDDITWESQYFDVLERAEGFQLENNRLLLVANNRVEAVFRQE